MVDWSENLICLIFFIFVYCFPLLATIYCNIYILRAARIGQRNRVMHCNSQRNKASNHKLLSRENKATFLLVAMVAAFIICWTPYVICSLVIKFTDYNLPDKFMSAALLLTVGNTCVNPFIYGALNKNFRDAFKRIIFSHRNFKI